MPSHPDQTVRIGIDAGGTFTDFVVLRVDGSIDSFKIRSNPASPAAVILDGIARATRGAKAEIVHGSTVATNALLERKGAKTAFLTTAGFEDLISIGRQNRAELYNLTPKLRRRLVPPHLCFGVRERAYFDGTVAARPASAELKRIGKKLKRAGIESLAICFLHAYQNPTNEQIASAALQGDLYISSSHEVAPEYREYERASTTVINAYVGPLMDAYLAQLEGHDISILQSNGGFITAREARLHAVRTILSGPAGGVVGAMAAAGAGGYHRMLSFDMGGTSTDVSLADGRPRLTTEAAIDGFPIRIPVLDIHTVGAGGGSLARVDEGGLLRVGPESAGAYPGPACYGIGDSATVTDAHVVLGRISADQFLGGEMRIDPARARDAVAAIARRLSLSAVAAAEGILRVANANMERAIRVVSVERGHDPRDFALVAFGGCGGLHACDIAQELGIKTVIVPQLAGALSAFGMLLADRVRDYSASALHATDPEKNFKVLERTARRDVPKCRLERFADLRYVGQSYELTVPWTARDAAAAFHDEHRRIYGYCDSARPVEMVTLRVKATIPVMKPDFAAALWGRLQPAAGSSPPPRSGTKVPRRLKPALRIEKRRVRVSGAWTQISVIRREQLSAKLQGPALVIDYGATTLIPRGWAFAVDPAGNLVVRRV